jgi:carbonic anhydrase/acetyltransferase-like protein (isoleucine patch superfamily)
VQSENFVCFWGPVVGDHPENYSDPNLRFTPAHVLDTLEMLYNKFVHEIRFCKDDTSTNLGKYKIIIVINDTWPTGGPTGWAFGSSYDDMIGAMWVHPNAVRDGAVLSHELTHSLQGQNNIDRNKTGGFRNQSTGSFWETHANFMRLQVYPQLAKEDLPRWMATRSFQYSSTRHHYCATNLLLTIQELDSLGMVSRLWYESAANEHPLMTYRRLKGWTQSQLNDFMWEYAKRDVIADFNVLGTGAYIRAERQRLQNAEPHYLWRQYTLLKRVNDSLPRYVVPDYQVPQDYGYNIIPLHPTCANRIVKVKFKGHTETTGAGWRYGFVAVKADGSTARYSASYASPEAEVTFAMKQDETALFLLVCAAPATHTTYTWEAGFPKIKRFPYELSIANAVPEGYQNTYRNEFRSEGHVHPNGGGWVSNSASVAPTVFVGPNAIVRGTAQLFGNVRVEGTAWVENAVLSNNVVVNGNGHVFGGTLSGSVLVTDNAILNYCTASGNVVAKQNALEWGVTLGGSVVVGGDAEIGNCSTSGVYLQTPNPNNGRAECDGKGASDISNIDTNPVYTLFSNEAMALSEAPGCGSTAPTGYRLLSFTGTRTDGANQLQWETMTDDNIARFELEYSTDSLHFVPIAIVTRSQAQLYKTSHASNSSNSYYRLRQVFITDSSTYSHIIKISTVVENLAMVATASTSYVSSWETLSAVNDGFTPLLSNDKSHGAYGNWYNPNSLQWVAYEWPSNAVINKVDLYWFDDADGVRTPTTAYLEYWHNNAWVRLADVPLVKDAFNQVALQAVNTSRLRVVMKNNVASTGILEFRVWGYYSLSDSVTTPPAYLAVNKATPAINDNNFTVKLLQNPVHGNQVDLQVNGAADQPLQILLTDINGRLITIKNIQRATTVEKQQLLLPGQASGVYFLKVATRHQAKTLKIIRL